MKNPFKKNTDDGALKPLDDSPDGGRLLTFLLVAAGIAVAAWFAFARHDVPATAAPVDNVKCTCTCTPADKNKTP